MLFAGTYHGSEDLHYPDNTFNFPLSSDKSPSWQGILLSNGFPYHPKYLYQVGKEFKQEI
jgi:hypothetical protein